MGSQKEFSNIEEVTEVGKGTQRKFNDAEEEEKMKNRGSRCHGRTKKA